MEFTKLLRAEIRRNFYNDSFSAFYIYSMIIWPIISFVQVNYNLKVFPIDSLNLRGINRESELLYFIFIGYSAYIFFQNTIQSCLRLGEERRMGTLSQIFLAPVNKLSWLYARALSMFLIYNWFFLIIFIIGNIHFMGVSIFNFLKISFSIIILMISSLVWGAFISVFFIVFRDGNLLFILLEGPQETFSGVQVPLKLVPIGIRIIGSLFPLSYTITLLRVVVLNVGENVPKILFCYIIVNIFVFFLTTTLLYIGEKHLRLQGAFDIY